MTDPARRGLSRTASVTAGQASVAAIFVAYGIEELDLSWIPTDVAVHVVHNDSILDPESVRHPGVRHHVMSRNIGFGAGMNVAAKVTDAHRLVMCNPDTVATPEHWNALASGDAQEITCIAQVDRAGYPTSVVNRYPTPLAQIATGLRLGRFVPRTSRLRRPLASLAGRWASDNAASLSIRSGRWPITTHWASGAMFSLDADRFRSLGGFDESYFLYFEDIDLCRRWGLRYPDTEIVMPATRAATHGVGGSATSGLAAERVAVQHLRSARLYAARQPGPGWRAIDPPLAARERLLDRRLRP